MVYLSYRLYKGETKMKKLVLIFMMVIMGFGCGKDITTKEYREKIGLPFAKTSTLKVDDFSVIYKISEENEHVDVTYTVLRANSITEDYASEMKMSIVKRGFIYLGEGKYSFEDSFLLYNVGDLDGTNKKMIMSTLISKHALKTLDKEYFNFLSNETTQKVGKYLLDIEKLKK